VLLQDLGVNIVDKLESQFLTMPLSSMFEPGAGNSSACVGNINALGIYFGACGFQGDGRPGDRIRQRDCHRMRGRRGYRVLDSRNPGRNRLP
jgi:hypothetical protein